jgi:hypothetical protein
VFRRIFQLSFTLPQDPGLPLGSFVPVRVGWGDSGGCQSPDLELIRRWACVRVTLLTREVCGVGWDGLAQHNRGMDNQLESIG